MSASSPSTSSSAPSRAARRPSSTVLPPSPRWTTRTPSTRSVLLMRTCSSLVGMDAAQELGHPIWDADNHYYEALDAFTRHLPAGAGPRCVQWATVDGKQYHV